MVFPRQVAAALSTLWIALGAAHLRADDDTQYNRDIRPILAENCFRCHGPDSASRKAELRLDRREAAVEKGAIMPGDPSVSELIARVTSKDPDEVMPPPDTKKVLSDKDKDLLKRWIAAGAEYQPHWSFIPPVRQAPPAVKRSDWVRNPIDYFVLARLEAMGLAPAPEADRRTLARRVCLDLTGVPPAPAEVEAFVNDPAPDAYERYVDRLLSSKSWGEHRGRYWLDAARYADTHGIHMDNFREAWAYRDWVIAAFNRNLSYDQFLLEQLAGDLFENRTLEQQVASGFNRCNITTSEGGAISEEYLVLYDRDRTETMSQVFMGLTAGCAVCHDHKFDPLTQKEFYELAAFFNNTTQPAMDGNVPDTPPTVRVPMAEERGRWDQLTDQITVMRKRMDSRRDEALPEFEQWLAEASPERVGPMIPSDGLEMQAGLDEGKGKTLKVSLAGESKEIDLPSNPQWTPGHVNRQSLRTTRDSAKIEVPSVGNFEKDQPFSCGAWVNVNGSKRQSGAVIAHMDNEHDYRGWDIHLQLAQVAVHIISKWDDNALRVITDSALPANRWNHVFVVYDGSGKAEGIHIYINGVRAAVDITHNSLKDSIKTDVPLTIGQRNSSDKVPNLSIQDARVYNRALSSEEVEQLAKGTRARFLVSKPVAQRTKPERGDLLAWWLSAYDKTWRELQLNLRKSQEEQTKLKERSTIAHVMQEQMDKEATAFVLFRGEYDKRRDEVHPGTPAFLPPMGQDLPKNRLGLAKWLLAAENPLTARVAVNRMWQEVFGTGIVRTTGDFGVSGELPSHPELLDWMAVEFRDSGWDMKKFYRMLVMSAAYRQSAVTTPEKLEKDPQNRSFARGPRFRMDAEMIRDCALATSGLLVPTIGGPSVKPYQPDGVWEAVAMNESNTKAYARDHGANLYRRSMYTFWKRSAPPALMEIFNAPSREACTVRRDRTDTPLQALATLNDPQFVEAARRLAETTLREGGAETAGRINFIAQRLLSRPLSAEEMSIVEASFGALAAHYQSSAEDAAKLISVGESKADSALDPAQLAAWTMLTNELMNLDEALNK